MRKGKWIARILAIALTINTAGGYVPPAQSVQAGGKPEAQDMGKAEVYSGHVSLNPEGGAVSPQEIVAKAGEVYGTLPTPVRTGYDFMGWFTQENGGIRVDETSLAGDYTELYAHWKPLSVRIDLYANGGKLDKTELQVTFGRTFEELPTPEKAGYQFDGWYTAYDGGERVEPSDLVTITSAAPLYAHWKGMGVTVTFRADEAGVEIPAETVEYGMAYGTLPQVNREGYLFAGWYDSPQGGRRITETTPVLSQEAHTLYAQWSEEEAKVSLDAYGGTCDVAEITVYNGRALGTLPTPVKAGHIFLGWYTKNGEKEVLVTEVTEYAPELGTSFYAKWEGVRLTLTLYPLLGDEREKTIEVVYGEAYPKLPALERDNYNFEGWFTKSYGGEKIEAGEIVKLKTDTALYAHWAGKEYTVRFDANGGTVSKDSIQVIYGTLYGTLPTPTKTGYNFDGWYENTQEGAKKVTKNDAVHLSADVTLYAYWSPKRPEVTFNANGGSMYFNGTQSGTCSAPYYYDKPYGELPVPKREGYTFEGWFTEKTEGIQVFSSTKMLSAIEDTLYAHWSGNHYTVSLDAQGGVLGQKLYGVIFGQKYGELPTPEKKNYTFTGWKLGGEFGGTTVDAASSVKVAQDHTLYATYRGNAVKLLYDSNGGSSGAESKTVYYGEAAGTLRSPSRSGYVFLGWYAGSELITKDTIITLTEDTIIRAEWEKQGYKVTFDANGGECSAAPRIYSAGGTYGTLPVPTREGYTFQGWYTSSSSGTQIKATDTVKQSANTCLYAHWKGNTYTVTFDLNGGTSTTTSKTVTYGATYGTLPTPKRTGFTFAGWFTKKQYGYRVTSTERVETTQDHVLYAAWKQETFTITFEAGSGKVAYHCIGIPVGVSYSAFPVPVREGYIFDGWYTSNTSTTKITSLAETDVLYAHWQPDTYRVSFDSCGGTGCAPVTVTYAKTYGTLPTPTKTGLSFAGWYTEAEGGTKVSSGTTMKKAYDHVLYAHWNGITSKLSYDSNGGSSITTTKSITSGKAYGTLATTSRTGYQFLGWYTQKEGGTLITSESIVTVTQDQKLYAHWDALRPTIRFVSCGGDIFTAEGNVGLLEVEYTYGQKYATFPKVSRTGYTFSGWFTGQTNGTQVTQETVCEVTTTDTFYAHWEGIENTVSFDTNGGDGAEATITVVHGDTYGTLPTPTRPGYTFSGWYTQKTGGEKITSASKVEILAAQTLYAQWEKKTYKVTLDGNGGTSIVTGTDGRPTSVSTRTVTTTYGGTYGGSLGYFPTFSRTGYEFAGFFTQEEGGSKITAQSVFFWEENQTIYAHWEPKNIVVTFYVDGGSPVQSVKRVPYQEAYGELPAPAKEGYVFDSWRTSKGGTTRVTADTVMKKTDGHTLYAAWTAKEYTLTFDAMGGEPDVSTKTAVMGQDIGTLPKVTREGYKLSGWYTKPAGGIAIKAATKLNVPGDRRYYAQWAEAEIEVRLLSGGKAVAVKKLLKGDCYGRLPAAEKEGYDFTGWFTEATGGEEVTQTDRCNAADDMALYAQFKTKTPTLLFYANGGNMEKPSKVVTYKEACGKLPVPTLENYEFAGWYTEQEGGTKITETSVVTFTDTTTVYAHWNPAALSVTFDPCGGNVTVTSKELTYEKPYGELPAPTKEGFMFDGWYTQKDGGQRVLASTVVKNRASHTLYAHWEKVCMQLIFDAGEGTCAVTSKELAAGEAYGELPAATRTGYRFAGWYTKAQGGELVQEDNLFVGDGNVTVYAHWEAERYTVTFHAMGGTCSVEQKEVVFGQTYGELPKAEYEGFSFVDWYLDVAGQNKVTADSIVETAGDHTLYAYYLEEAKDVNARIRAFHFGEAGANPITGNVSFSSTDMVISIPGAEYMITRTYNSQNKEDSILGHGWSFGFEARCEAYSDGVIVYLPDGSSDIFWLIEDGSYQSKYSRRAGEWISDDVFLVTEPDQVKYYFNRDGSLACIEDRYGNRTEVVYTDGRISGLTDAAGRKYTLETNGDGKLVKLTNPVGHEVLYTYNEKGYLASVTNVLGGTVKYMYDEEGYIAQIIDPDGSVVMRFSYGEDKRPIGGGEDKKPVGSGEDAGKNLYAPEQKQKLAAMQAYTMDKETSDGELEDGKPADGSFGDGKPTGGESGDGKPTGGESGNGRPINPGTVEENPPKTTDIQVTTYVDAYGGTKTYAYDPEKNQTQVTSEDGREWIYWYNSDMYVTAVQNPDGSMEKTEYAEQEEGFHYADITSETDEYGNQTSYTLDADGNVTMITYADGSTQKMWYDAWDNCVIECSQNNIYTYHVYDENGVYLLKNVCRVDGAAIVDVTEQNLGEKLKDITCTNPDYIVEEYQYYTDEEAEEKFHSKLHGLLAQTINPEGETQSYAYDAYGNATAVTDAAGNTCTYTYDAFGNRLSETTARGDVYRWEYLPNGYVTREHYPDGGTAVSVYDASGHLLQTVKPEQYEPDKDLDGKYTGTGGTFYQYGTDGRLHSMTGVLGDITNYIYDTNGNVTEETKQGAEVISYAYDQRNRLTKTWYQENASAPKRTFEVYTYEALKDGEHKVTAERYTDLQEKMTQVTIYDNMGREKEAYLLSDGEKAAYKKYAYYPDGALRAVTENGYTTTWQYDAQGNVTVVEKPFMEEDGVIRYTRTENRYDRAGRLLEMRVGEAGGDAVAVTRYRYENGRLVEEISPDGIHTYYTYDADDNIIREQTGDGTVEENTALITDATYDFRGSLLTQTVWVRAEDVEIQGQEVPVVQAALAGRRHVAAGLTTRQTMGSTLCALTTSFEYDLDGRLTRESAPDGTTVLHSYDMAGNETATEVRNPDGTLATRETAVYNTRGQATQVTDALGAVTKYTYDNRGNTTKVEDALGGVTLYVYNYYDQLITEVSPANYRAGKSLKEMARTEYTYDSLGRIRTQTDYEFDEDKIHSVDRPDGFYARVTATYTYDKAGNNVQIKNAKGKGAVRTYHPNGLVATHTSAAEMAKTDGITLSYRYDIFGNTVGIRAGEYERRYQYDPEGRLLSESDSYGTLATYTYDTLGRLRTKTDAAGAVTYYEYNALGEISSQKVTGDASVPELEIFYTYDRAGRLVQEWNSAGNRTTYTYDSLGSLLTQTAHDAQTGEALTVSYTYDGEGNCTSMTDPAGTRTEYCYDALGRKTAESVYAAGRENAPKTTQWEYDADGNNILVRDYLGNETRAEYDSLGRLTAQYDALGCLIAAYHYDDCDRQTSSVDALGNETAYAYDDDGNITMATAPDGAVTTYTYDYAGNQISQTDAKGNRTLYTYDGRNRLTAVTNALGEQYCYTYDNAGNQTSQTDPAGKGIFYTYNVRGSIATRQYIGEATVESYYYTADGQLAEKTDRNGTQTIYAYDGFGRLVLEQAGTDQKTYTYDNAGNLLTATDGGVATTRTYDAEGRVTSKTVDGIGTTVYIYDLNPAGGEVSERSTAPDGITTETLYDKVGRVSLISSSDGTWAAESYYKNGSRKSTDYGDGSGQEYRYDAAGRITALVHRDKDGKETERYTYTYDANGNLTCESSSRGAVSYTYDALDRLTSVTEPEGRVTEYTYDASGNRATKTERHGDVAVRTVYTYDAANLLVGQEGDDGTVVAYTYDANGNLLSEETAGETKDTGDTLAAEEITVPDGEGDVIPSGDEQGTAMSAVAEGSLAVDALLPAFLPDKTETVTGSAIDTEDTVFFTAALETVSGSALRLYTYDNFNRLTAYQSGDTLAAYTYNAEDYRIIKQVVSPDKETFTRYFYEGSHVTLEADAVGNITAHNTYSINLASRTVGGEGYYYFYNAHGDVVKLAGIRSGVEITYRYDAFGTLIEANGEADNSITYAGYQYDAESGLYYLNARYYDSTTARFLTEDTYAGQADDPLSLNRYTYCANNPLRYTDPSGHFFVELITGIVMAAHRFISGALIGGGLEYLNQTLIERRKEVDWNAVAYEALAGGVGALFGGGVSATGTLAKRLAKAGVKEAFWGGVEDIGRQALVEGKNLWELDLERLGQTAGIAGIGGVFGAWTEYRADCRRNAKQTKKYVQREVEVEKEVWTAVKEKKLAFSCRNGHVGCEKLENIFPVYVEDTKWVKKTVKQKELVGKWEYGWEYNGSDRSFSDYLEEYLGKNTDGKTKIKNGKDVNGVFTRYMPDGSTVMDFADLPGTSGIEVPRRLSTEEMSFLTKEYNVEFAQVYRYGNGTNGGGGKYFVYSGDIKSVKVPIEKDVMLINHTHPKGTAYPSAADKMVLENFKLKGSPQKISEIIPIGKKNTVKFGMDGIK